MRLRSWAAAKPALRGVVGAAYDSPAASRNRRMALISAALASQLTPQHAACRFMWFHRVSAVVRTIQGQFMMVALPHRGQCTGIRAKRRAARALGTGMSATSGTENQSPHQQHRYSGGTQHLFRIGADGGPSTAGKIRWYMMGQHPPGNRLHSVGCYKYHCHGSGTLRGFHRPRRFSPKERHAGPDAGHVSRNMRCCRRDSSCARDSSTSFSGSGRPNA
jgi:hypothetical protein